MPNNKARDSDGQDWLTGGGEMGKVVRSKDWSKTPLGPKEKWPQSLRTTVSLCLASNFPISLAWGTQFTQIYNDGYWPICGGKHPNAMGQDFRECWASAWPAIGEAFERAVGGETSFLEDQRMFLDRNGYLEETFFTFSFSPIRDESGGVGGLFHPVTETTSKMLIERRTRALRDLAGRTGEAKSTAEALKLAAQALTAYELDLPFTLFYTLDDKDKAAELSFSNGMPPGAVASPSHVQLVAGEATWPLAEAAESRKPIGVSDLEQRFGPLSCGPYPESPKAAVVLPITPPGCERPVAVLIAGVSSRLPLNDLYRNFYEQMAASVTAAVANARAYEAEKERVEKLAALDRAKTVFFSNVSHELRTPLTLMLGPLEDTLGSAGPALPTQDRENLALAHRSGLRLLKLVNSLLDFSRIEAGRIQASYTPEDLATLTGSLASVFRSAIERGGLQLIVDCPPLDECVYVDREMWEKIVLNLLSNAFKFTLWGRIVVRQHREGDAMKLSVEDTGCGIAESELGNIFKRFYRVERSEGRTYEGSGIGLALVQELVHLHGGAVTAQSVLGKGSTFTVSLPVGKAHLPADRIGAERSIVSTGTSADAYTEEALRWIQENTEDVLAATAGNPETDKLPCVLIADDNADMRQYLERLLGAQHEVVSAPDGEAAWAAILNRRPDLLLSDVMMPRLDGFGLLARIRAHAETATLPVVLLSARAGEESKVEGLQAGADDYLIKPFSARELRARVRANLETSALRQKSVRIEEQLKSEAEFRTLANAIPQLCWMANADGWISWYNERWYEYTGTSPEQMEGWGWESIHDPDTLPKVMERWKDSIDTGKPFEMVFPLRGADGVFRPFLTRVMPVKDAEGKVVRWFGTNTDINEQKQIEAELRKSKERLDLALEVASVGEWELDLKLHTGSRSKRHAEIFGDSSSALDWSFESFIERVVPELRAEVTEKVKASLISGVWDFETQIRRAEGEIRWIWARGCSLLDETGKPVRMYGTVTDITERKQHEAERDRLDRQKRLALDAAELGWWHYDPITNISTFDDRYQEIFEVFGHESLNDEILARLNSGDLPVVLANVKAALDPVDPEPYSATYRINMPDGSQKWIEAHGIATFEGEGHNRCATSLAGTVQDITERKRAEEALRQSLERLEKVMEIETVGVMFWDLNTGCMMDANDTFLKLMGYSRSQVEARELNWQNLTPPEYMDVSRAEVEKFLATGRVGPYEKEYFRKDGTRRWLLFAGSSLGNNQCVEFCVDIADRKKAEQQLVDLNQQLEDRVRRRTAELEAANKELEAFSYSVSHDLRSPLRAISGFSQAVMEDYGSRLPAEGQEYLGTICRGAMRMGELIDDLLAFSRLSRQSISLSPVNTCNLVSQCLEDLKSTYMDRVIEFSVDELPPCLGDRALLKQVWTNLLSNAIKFTSNRPLASVQVGVQFEPGKVVYFIKDNGAGFDMKYANKLFGVFQRLHRNDEFEGTGVGLAIVQRIVHRHGGRVWADAVLDQGATFYFTVAEEGKCIYE